MKRWLDRRSKVERGIDSKIEGFLEGAQTRADVKELITLVTERNEMSCVKPRIKPDTWLIVGGNILGILLILNHERLGVVSSKALGFVLRGRV